MLMGGGGGGDDEKKEEKLFKFWGTSSAHLTAIQPSHILAMAGHNFIVTDIAVAATVFYYICIYSSSTSNILLVIL